MKLSICTNYSYLLGADALRPFRKSVGLVVSVVILSVLPLSAQSRVALDGKEEDSGEINIQAIPFGFFSESFGLGLGVGGGISNWPQQDSTLLGAVTLGTSGSYNLALGGSQLQMPGVERLTVNPMLILARYQDQLLFVGRENEGFAGQRAGANDSDPDNVYSATQWDNLAEVEFRYLLPIGHGRNEPVMHTYKVKDGLLVSGASGGESWNPLVSGRTWITLTPAWRKQTLDNDAVEVPLETRNVEVALERDNRDFPFNPSTGSFQRLLWQKDFRDEDALGGWEFWELQVEGVWDLGKGAHSLQRVLAVDAAWGYVPTWETDAEENVTRRPPQYEGVTLGGLDRMRGFESNRFHDKAGVYYGAEFRVIPEWQPIQNIDMLDWAQIQYWQWALFVEAGQVGSSWDLAELHDDLHVDVGISLRGMIYKAVCRLDVAVSEEGSRVVAMYGHPF